MLHCRRFAVAALATLLVAAQAVAQSAGRQERSDATAAPSARFLARLPAVESLPGADAGTTPEVNYVPPPGEAFYGVMPPPESQQQYDPTLGPTLRVFEPKARVYFDTGWEAPDKLDIFHDGSLVPSINFVELFWQRPWGRFGRPDWRWGPAIGVGISSQAGDSSDGTLEASGAPVLLLSGGLQYEFPLTAYRPDVLPARDGPPPTAGIEFGYAGGISSDESLDYSADGAIYVGVSLHILP